MARGALKKVKEKNNVTNVLPAMGEGHSGEQSRYYWVHFLLGFLSLGLLLQRFQNAMPANAGSRAFDTLSLPHDNRPMLYPNQFSGLAPFMLGSALTYQSGNSVIGILGSLPWWFAAPVAAQSSAVSNVIGEFRVNSNTTGGQLTPVVASVSAEEWVVVWYGDQTGSYSIYGQRYSVNGSVLGSEFRVNSNTAGGQLNPAVASLGAGEWVVVWHGGQTGDFDIYGQRYAASGNVLGSEFRVNSNTTAGQLNPSVTSVSAGEWVVVWYGGQIGNSDIYAQRYAVNGSELGTEFRVNSNTTGQQQNPVVASVAAGEWVVLWEGDQTGDFDIYAQRYAMNGSVLGAEFRVNSNTVNNQYNFAMASVGAGEWVVVWEGSQTSSYNIYAQRFATNGSLLGPEFRVNNAMTGFQLNPAVAGVSSGELAMAWEGTQTGDYDVYGQWYAANGSVLESGLRVNSNRTGTQDRPVVASLSPGKWVVVWMSGPFSNRDIYASIFSSTAPLSTSASPTASSSQAASIVSTTVKSVLTTQLLSTSFSPLPTVTNNTATLSTLTNSQASSTSPSTVTTQVFTTSLSTATNDNSVKTPAITTPLNTFASPSSTGVSGTVTIVTHQTPDTSTTQQQVMTTNAHSGVSGVVIGAVAGAGGFGVAACLGAIGFYAYRKKSRAGQANPSAVSEAGASLKPIAQTSAQSTSEYAQVNLKEASQSDNIIPGSDSQYGRIDEMKRVEKEYDNAPGF